jgi:hypothetical protein
VAKAHEAIIEQNANFPEQVKEALHEHRHICDGFADKPQKRAELQPPFYALPEGSKTPFFDRKYAIHYVVAVVLKQEPPMEPHGE